MAQITHSVSIVGAIEFADITFDVCAVVDASFHPCTGELAITLDSFLRASIPFKERFRHHPAWLPAPRTVHCTSTFEAARETIRTIADQWRHAVMHSIPEDAECAPSASRHEPSYA